jgi:hypothetical protein
MAIRGDQRIHSRRESDSHLFSQTEEELRDVLTMSSPSEKEAPTEEDRVMLWIIAAFMVLLSCSAAMWFIVVEHS